jgi:hypothetical protein
MSSKHRFLTMFIEAKIRTEKKFQQMISGYMKCLLGPILYLVFVIVLVIVLVIMHISNVYLLVLSKATGQTLQKPYY